MEKIVEKYKFYWKYWEQPKRRIHSLIFRDILKWDNATLIQYEANKHRNELVYFTPNAVFRLLGWTDQYDDDYYWIIIDSFNVRLYSCCGGFMWLKGKLSKHDYYYSDYLFELNYPIKHAFQQIKERNIILK